MIALHHIACTWNPELPDARCASLRRRAERHLGLRLNGLRHVSVYAVRAALDAAQLERLACEGLSDAVAQRVGLDRLPDGLREIFRSFGIHPDTVREVMKKEGYFA